MGTGDLSLLFQDNVSNFLDFLFAFLALFERMLKTLEYQQNNFSLYLQFCPAYNLPIWLHAFNIQTADFRMMRADVIWSRIERL